MNITQYRVSAVVCLGLLLLAGCQGNENSVTGTSSGTRFLSGEVQMVGNLAGASPAGVSVMAQGQVATTDGAGRFAFMSRCETEVISALRNDVAVQLDVATEQPARNDRHMIEMTLRCAEFHAAQRLVDRRDQKDDADERKQKNEKGDVIPAHELFLRHC